MRAITASEIVPTAMAGRIRCFMASPTSLKFPVTRPFKMAELETSASRNALTPVTFCSPHTFASGTMETPADKRPLGGSWNGVPFRTSANK